MDLPPQPRPPDAQDCLDALLSRALSLDLEVSHAGKLLDVGAVLGDTALVRCGADLGSHTWEKLAQLCARASLVLGHNLVRHDLPMLGQTVPNHPLLCLPAVDTLVLSPLAFPENPYHRLVKDYKLMRETVNDPVADARLAAALFGDQFRAFAGLRQTEPGLFDLLRFLLTTPADENDRLAQGMGLFFQALDGCGSAASRESTAGSAAEDLRRSDGKPPPDALDPARVEQLAQVRLLSRLKIAARCSLVVKGGLRACRIHLDSGNILMEPDGRTSARPVRYRPLA